MNRSQIRQSALALVYAVVEQGVDFSGFDLELFWSIAQEKERDRFRMAQAKALLHVARMSADVLRLLKDRTLPLLEAMQGDLTTAALRQKVERYAQRSQAFGAALQALQYCLSDKRRDTTDQLELCCRDVLVLAATIVGLGEELLPKLADFPLYRQVLQPYAAVVRRCGRMMAAVAELDRPLELPSAGEMAAYVRYARNLHELRPAAEALASQVLEKRGLLDERLAGLVAHYVPERMDVVDKCILYLALYELEVERLETAIVVSEATALAHAYSGGKSAPFIHGIIASAAQSQPK